LKEKKQKKGKRLGGQKRESPGQQHGGGEPKERLLGRLIDSTVKKNRGISLFRDKLPPISGPGQKSIRTQVPRQGKERLKGVKNETGKGQVIKKPAGEKTKEKNVGGREK